MGGSSYGQTKKKLYSEFMSTYGIDKSKNLVDITAVANLMLYKIIVTASYFDLVVSDDPIDGEVKPDSFVLLQASADTSSVMSVTLHNETQSTFLRYIAFRDTDNPFYSLPFGPTKTSSLPTAAYGQGFLIMIFGDMQLGG